jgi:DNA-binding MarR family transcriptional regulator
MTDMDAHEAQLAEDRMLARMLIVVGERARADFGTAVSPFGLPVPLARALLLLVEPMPMREMAGHLGCDPSYITGIADQLEERGLVTRAPGKDRRVKVLQVTPEGTALRERIAEAVRQQAGFSRHLSPNERITLRHLLERLLQADDGGHPSGCSG